MSAPSTPSPAPSVYGRRRTPPPVEREMGARTVFMDERPRCTGLHRGQACNKVLAEFVTRPWSIQCRHCKTTNTRNVPPLGVEANAVTMQAPA